MKKLTLITAIACLSVAVFAQSAGPSKTPALNKKQLTATWKTEGATYTFDKTGASQVIINGRTCPGTWALDGNTLTITPKKLMWKQGDVCGKTQKLEVKSLNSNALEVIETSSQTELHLAKQK